MPLAFSPRSTANSRSLWRWSSAEFGSFEEEKPRVFQQRTGDHDQLPFTGPEIAERGVDIDVETKLAKKLAAACLHFAP